jgi:hypothetical protein
MGFIVSGTGTFTSGFVVMSVLAVGGALLMLLVPREPPHDRELWAPEKSVDGTTVPRL